MPVYFWTSKMYIYVCKSVLMSFRCCVLSVDYWPSVVFCQLLSLHKKTGEHSCLYCCVVIIPVLCACLHTVALWRVIFSFDQWASDVFQMFNFKSFKLFAKSWFDLFLLIFVVTRCSYGVSGCTLLYQTKNKMCSDKVYLWSMWMLTFVSDWIIYNSNS